MAKKLFLFAKWSLSIAALFFIVLGIHIYMVTSQYKKTELHQQLSRIDFKQPVDSSEAIKIQGFVSSLEGVHKTYFNYKDAILVYLFDIDKQTSQKVFDRLVAFGNYKAERYIVDAGTMSSGCPVMVKQSGFYKNVTNFYKKLFSLFS